MLILDGVMLSFYLDRLVWIC